MSDSFGSIAGVTPLCIVSPPVARWPCLEVLRGAEPYHRRTMSTDLEDAWSDLHDAKPAGLVRRASPPTTNGATSGSSTPSTRPSGLEAGVRSREWTAVAPTELEVVRELARCLRLIREGRVPE